VAKKRAPPAGRESCPEGVSLGKKREELVITVGEPEQRNRVLKSLGHDVGGARCAASWDRAVQGWDMHRASVGRGGGRELNRGSLTATRGQTVYAIICNDSCEDKMGEKKVSRCMFFLGGKSWKKGKGGTKRGDQR